MATGAGPPPSPGAGDPWLRPQTQTRPRTPSVRISLETCNKEGKRRGREKGRKGGRKEGREGGRER